MFGGLWGFLFFVLFNIFFCQERRRREEGIYLDALIDSAGFCRILQDSQEMIWKDCLVCHGIGFCCCRCSSWDAGDCCGSFVPPPLSLLPSISIRQSGKHKHTHTHTSISTSEWAEGKKAGGGANCPQQGLSSNIDELHQEQEQQEQEQQEQEQQDHQQRSTCNESQANEKWSRIYTILLVPYIRLIRYIAEKYTRYIYSYTRLYMTAINMYTHSSVSLLLLLLLY